MGSAPRAISYAGISLFAIYIAILMGALWPIQLLAPAFQLRLGTQLINSGPIALIGLALLQLGRLFDPDDRWLERLCRQAAALAVAAAFGFAFLVPLLAVASIRQQHNLARTASAQLRSAESQLQSFRQVLDTSISPAELDRGFKALKGPRLDPVDWTLPMPQLRIRVEALLERLASQVESQRRLLPSIDVWQKLPEILRTSFGALALAGGFAALASRPARDVSLLEEPLLAWSSWQKRRLLRRQAKGRGRRRSAPPDEDYIRQLSGENDGRQ